MKKTIVYLLILTQLLFFTLLPIWMELINYLHPLVIGVTWFCYTFLLLFLTCFFTRTEIKISQYTFYIVTFLYCLALFVLLFFRPTNQGYETINLVPFETIQFYLSGNVAFVIAVYNLAANIGLFIPFGLIYRYMRGIPSFIFLLTISIVSVGIIEGLQYVTKRGSLDVDDLILNVIGITFGYFLYPVFQKVVKLESVSENKL